MDYDTESIAEIAQQVTKAFQAAVVGHQQAGGQALTIADIETGLRQFLRQVGLKSLSQFLSTGTGTPVAEIACPCGGGCAISGNGRPPSRVCLAGCATNAPTMPAVVVERGKPPWMPSMGWNPGRSRVGWRRC